MRLLIDSMIVVMVLAIIIGAVQYRHQSTRHQRDMQTVREGLGAFEKTLQFQGALWQAREQDAGPYPPQVMPRWFNGTPPRNPLVAGDRPWMDIAPPEDYQDQPPDPLATEPGQAAFWYNPTLGVVRARVPQQDTNRLTLDLYNRVNGTSLSALPHDHDPQRTPLAMNLNPVTAGQHASPDGRTVGQVQALESLSNTTTEAQATGEQAPADVTQDTTPWWEKSTDKDRPQAEPVAEVTADEAPARKSLLSP